MDAHEVLSETKWAAENRCLHFSAHAFLVRMPERGVGKEDVVVAILGAQVAVPGDKGAWHLIGGRDTAGETLDVVVRLIHTVLVVTVF